MNIALMLHHGLREGAPNEATSHPHMELLASTAAERDRLKVIAEQLKAFGSIPYSFHEVESIDHSQQGAIMRIFALRAAQGKLILPFNGRKDFLRMGEEMGETMAEKLVIIGSGPAGWTAAIYAARANLQPLIYEGAITEENRLRGVLPLGQLNLTTEVENFPGFPGGVMGPELMLKMREQAERYGTRIVTEDIVSVDLSRRPFVVNDPSGTAIEAQSLIIATGASANYIGLESESHYKNRGVSACAVCDGALPRFRNRDLIVVGGGDSAAEEGNYLTKFARTVHLVHRRDSMSKASRIMADRLLSNPKVKPVWNSAVEEVLGEEEQGMTAVRIKNLKTGDSHEIPAAGMFVAIGHTPNTKFLHGQLTTDDKGFVILKDPFRTTTSVEGVFAAGDVADPVYKQAITAAGMGCKAALDAERWLAAQGVD